jgi:hypothetical protein
VCEVRYDHFSGGRFRHGTKFLRWRPDKAPRQCTVEQVRPRSATALASVLAWSPGGGPEAPGPPLRPLRGSRSVSG